MKYPLLLDQFAKQCDNEDFDRVKRLVDRTREILESIDKQVAEAQNVQRLMEIQQNLNTSGLEKMANNLIAQEYRVRICSPRRVPLSEYSVERRKMASFESPI